MADLIVHYRQLVGIAKTWAMKHLEGFDEDAHRSILIRHGAAALAPGSKVSSLTLNLAQLGAVLKDYQDRGWPRHQKLFRGGSPALSVKKVSPQIGLMVKLWGKLGSAGKIRNSSRAALLAFCARQTARNVPDLDSLTDDQHQAIIEAIKAMLRR